MYGKSERGANERRVFFCPKTKLTFQSLPGILTLLIELACRNAGVALTTLTGLEATKKRFI